MGSHARSSLQRTYMAFSSYTVCFMYARDELGDKQHATPPGAEWGECHSSSVAGESLVLCCAAAGGCAGQAGLGSSSAAPGWACTGWYAACVA